MASAQASCPVVDWCGESHELTPRLCVLTSRGMSHRGLTLALICCKADSWSETVIECQGANHQDSDDKAGAHRCSSSANQPMVFDVNQAGEQTYHGLCAFSSDQTAYRIAGPEKRAHRGREGDPRQVLLIRLTPESGIVLSCRREHSQTPHVRDLTEGADCRWQFYNACDIGAERVRTIGMPLPAYAEAYRHRPLKTALSLKSLDRISSWNTRSATGQVR